MFLVERGFVSTRCSSGLDAPIGAWLAAVARDLEVARAASGLRQNPKRSGAARTRGALAPRASQAQRARPRRARAPCRSSRARTRRRRSIPSGARLFPPTSRARAPRTFATRARPLGRPHRSTPARARRRRAAPPFPPTPLPARPAHAPPPPRPPSPRSGAIFGLVPSTDRSPNGGPPTLASPGDPGLAARSPLGGAPRGALLSPDRAAEFTQYACVHPPPRAPRPPPRRRLQEDN